MSWQDRTEFSDLIGKTITAVEGGEGDDIIDFFTSDGEHYKMLHYQDCCEYVTVDDVVGGRLQDLVGEEILDAYESSHVNEPPTSEWAESYTWTFYTIRTMNRTLTIRWYGESNGYYSESVDFEKVAG